MCAGQQLDGVDLLAVAGHRTVLVAIGTHQVCQHLHVAGIALGARHRMAVAVATAGQRIDGIDRVARRHQRPDPQPAVGLDPDYHLRWGLGELGQQRVQLSDARGALGEVPPDQALALLVKHHHVVMGLRPIVPDEDHRAPLLANEGTNIEKKQRLGDLMDQCSQRHDISPAIGSACSRAGALSSLELQALRSGEVLTGPRLDPTSLAPTPD